LTLSRIHLIPESFYCHYIRYLYFYYHSSFSSF